MAPLPETNTARVTIFYTAGTIEHSFQVRHTDGKAAEAVQDAFDYLQAIQDLLREIRITRVTSAAKGSTLSFPMSVFTQAPVFGSGQANPKETALFVSATGRDGLGRRVKVSVFGAKDNYPANDFRLQANENGGIQAGINALNSFDGTFVTVSGGKPIWNNYLNIGFNAYWQRELR